MRYPAFYDYEKRKCKICNMLLQPDLDLLKYHSKDSYHLLKKLKKEFSKEGEVNMKIETKFKLGDTVSAEIMGEIVSINLKHNGKIEYKIEDSVNNIYGYFLESQVYPLPTDKEE